ncbi:MAG: Gfo/Idh/MocA family protein [Aestuariibacter sp.]
MTNHHSQSNNAGSPQQSDSSDKNPKKRVGFVGCGWVAQQVWLPILGSYPNVELVVIVDPSQDIQQKMRQQFPNIACFDTTDGLKSMEALDLVFISSPNVFHYPQAKQVLELGINVVIEKPACFYGWQLNELINTAQTNEVRLWVSSASVNRPDVQKMLSLATQEQIGNITSVSARWIRGKGIPNPGSWFTDKKMAIAGAGADLGWHLADVALLFFSDFQIDKHICQTSDLETVDESIAAGWKTDMDVKTKSQPNNIDVEVKSYCCIQTKNQQLMHLEAAWISHEKYDHTQIIVEGTNGVLQLDTTFGFSTNTLNEPSLILKKRGQVTHYDVPEFHKMAPYEHFIAEVMSSFESDDSSEYRHYLATTEIMEAIFGEEVYEDYPETLLQIDMTSLQDMCETVTV